MSKDEKSNSSDHEPTVADLAQDGDPKDSALKRDAAVGEERLEDQLDAEHKSAAEKSQQELDSQSAAPASNTHDESSPNEVDVLLDGAGDESIVDGDTAQSDEQNAKSGVVDAAAVSEQVSVTAGRPGRALVLFALLLALLSAAGSGFLGWQFYQQSHQRSTDSQTQSEQTQTIAQTVDRQFETIDGLSSDLGKQRDAIEKRFEQQQSQLESVNKKLDESQLVQQSHGRRLLSLTATTTDDWRVAEVEYLLRLASQRIMISGDVATATELVEAADQILVELADPRLLEIRRSISEDRAALKRVASLDIDGMFLRLAALANNVDKLPVLSIPTFEPEAAAVVTPRATDLADDEAVQEGDGDMSFLLRMQDVVRSGWLEIRSWLVINRKDLEIKPLLPPEQQYYLRGNLQLLLNQAQLALLDKRVEPYESSLQTAVVWLRSHFPANEPAIENTISELQELAAQNISPQLPDLSASLLAVKAFMSERFNEVSDSPPEAADQAEGSEEQQSGGNA